MYVSLIFVFTLRTNTFQHKIGSVKREAFGQNDLGHCHIMKAEGALAVLTIEVHVKVRQLVFMLFPTLAVLFAKGEFSLPTTIFYLMNYVFLQEEVERAENGGTVHRLHFCLERHERNGAVLLLQGAQHQDSHGSRTNAASVKYFFRGGGHKGNGVGVK